MPRIPPAVVQQQDSCCGSSSTSCRRCSDGHCIGFIQHHTWRDVCRRCRCDRYWHIDVNDPENHIYENPSDYASVAYSTMSTLSSEGGNDMGSLVNGSSKNSFGNQTMSSMDSDSVSMTGNIRTFCLSPSTKLRLAADAHRQSTSDDDSGCVMDEYVWIPHGLKPDLVHQYFACLPGGKGAYTINLGDKWRLKQLVQLPPQDTETRYCRHLSASEQKEFKSFAQQRKRDALGRGIVKIIPYSLNGTVCCQCSQEVYAGELGIFASKAGDQVVWHPSCFVCHTCDELLIDLLYFYNGHKVYCGRHHAELLKPRCAACDEIIFANECTEADKRFWHVHHFSCFECDKTLGGTRYVMRDERPYCVDCFEKSSQQLHDVVSSCNSEMCSSCKRVLNKTDACLSHANRKWHANNQCFACAACRRGLLGEQFSATNDGLLFCDSQCAKSFQSEIPTAKKSAPNRKLRSHSASGRQRKSSTKATITTNSDAITAIKFANQIRQQGEYESDYESISPRLQRFNNGAGRMAAWANNGNNKQLGFNNRRCNNNNNDCHQTSMVQSVMTERKFDDTQSLSSHRSLPDLFDSQLDMSGQSSSSARPDFGGLTHRGTRFQDKTRKSNNDNNGNVVFTKLMERKETTFGVTSTNRDGSINPRTVRFLNERGGGGGGDHSRCSRRDELQSSFSRQNYCSSCSSSSSSEDEDDPNDGHFSYYTMTRVVQPKRERLKYVESNNNNNSNFGTVLSNKTATTKKSRTKSTGNNCIVS